MVGKVTILGLVRVAASRDDVHRKAPSAQVVERRKLAGSKRRRDEARSMRQQQTQPLGDGRGMGADEEAIWRIGEVANQDAIEIRLLVDAGRCRDDVSIERRSAGCHHLGRYARRDPANHLDRQSDLRTIPRSQDASRGLGRCLQRPAAPCAYDKANLLAWRGQPLAQILGKAVG